MFVVFPVEAWNAQKTGVKGAVGQRLRMNTGVGKGR